MRPLFLNLLLVFSLISFYCPAFAGEAPSGLYAYPTATGMKVGAVFGVLPELDQDDVLISATSAICDHVEIHTMSEEDGIFKMREVKTLDLVKGKENRLDASGYHLMLMDLKSPLKIGQSFELTLRFKKSAPQIMTIPVISRSQK